MLTKENVLTTILGQTGGTLKFQEQIIQIGLEVLNLSLEEANFMRKAFAKIQIHALEKYKQLFIENLGKEKGEETFKLLLQKGPYVHSRVLVETAKEVQRQSLQAILSKTNGELKYMYQLLFIFRHVMGLSESAIDSLLEKQSKGENFDLKQYILDFGKLDANYFTDFIDEVLQLIPENWFTLKQTTPVLVPFEENE